MQLKRKNSVFIDPRIQEVAGPCEPSDNGNNEEEDKIISIRATASSASITKESVPEAPPTHFIPVVVTVEPDAWEKFRDIIQVNRNIVIVKVGRWLMSSFMPGDQISLVNGTAIWNSDDLENQVRGPKKETKTEVTVIRVWNLKCLTDIQLDKLLVPPEEQLHYFSVKVYSSKGTIGLKLCLDKKRVLVELIRAKTPVNSALLVGDQILGINDELLTAKSKRALRKQVAEVMKKSIKKQGFAEIIACRQVIARSSPAPSLEAELSEKFANYAVGVEKGTRIEKKDSSETNSLPLHSDALEIALRELACLKQWIVESSTEVPPCDKGPTLMIDPPTAPGSAEGCPPPLVKAKSTTNAIERSVYFPLSTTAAVAIPVSTPKKRSIFRQQDRNSAINFAEQPDHEKITSDIPEEDDLKKCEPMSGIAAYIKKKFN